MNSGKVKIVSLVTVSDMSDLYLSGWEIELPVEEGWPSLRDDIWSAKFGQFQSELLSNGNGFHVTLRFSEIGWADPLSLLGLATTLRGFIEETESSLDVELGHPASVDTRRGAFLRFIAEHKFLRTFWAPQVIGRTRFLYNEVYHESDEEISALEQNLVSSGYLLAYDNSLCLRAKLFHVERDGGARTTDIEKAKLVSSCLDEIRDYGLKPLFSSRPELIDVLLYKFRVIIYELIENAFEHAFIDKDGTILGGYGGIYARVRKRASDSESEKRWNSARLRENANCPLLARFGVTAQSDWIEFFYYDPGRGLLTDLQSWAAHARTSGNKELSKIIAELKPTSNRLHKISRYMFGEGLSRFKREGRTALTGLQHIGLILASANDFARACVAREWVGGVHPWKDSIQPTPINYAKQHQFRDLANTFGTAWHFCIQVRPDDVVLPDYWEELECWKQKSPTGNHNLLPLTSEKLPEWQFFDERELAGRLSTLILHEVSFASETVVWLPGDVRKQRVHQWLSAVKKNKNVKTWVIADFPAYQAGPVSEILRRERLSKDLTIYLVTDDWRCACLSSPEEGKDPYPSTEKAQLFLKENVDVLYRLLRAYDSKLFWQGIPAEPPSDTHIDVPFVYECVNWEGSNGIRATLHGYLELTQALTEPLRAALCKRALLRTWPLFCRGTRCEPADSLLAGLLPEGSLRINNSPEGSTSEGVTIVSSVLVTGSTAERNHRRGYKATIHLFRHAHVEFEEGVLVATEEPVALDWMPTPPVMISPPSGKLPYQRIPGTPFIGRGGPKAIPIRRFGQPEQKKDGSYEVFKKPLYGESPGEMYEHFIRLGVLKLGHWSYEGHHDLFTVNLAKAYALESIDNGPLVHWLTKRLMELCESGVRVMIYPSHLVTDHIVRHLRERHPSCLPQHVIPVHFLGRHSQSSIRIPSLTYDRIREILKAEKLDGKQQSVVLFDDGTVTGKVAREMEHLIKNAGASTVYTLTLINRTGLPLYRKLISYTSKVRKHFWRWDVPALGSRRTCPLCRAVEQARLVAANMPNGPARIRVDQWISLWDRKNVVLNWEDHGLNPMALPNPRPMTFGKEWLPDATVKHYEVMHTTTTGIAAMVAELMRTTTYKAVGLKVADEPAGINYKGRDNVYKEPEGERKIWDRTRLEILVGQALLFFDDLDKHELVDRFNRIFSIVVRSSGTGKREIDALAGLTLLLADKESAETLFSLNQRELCHTRVSSPDGELVLGYILVKSKIDWLSWLDHQGDKLTVDERALLRENLTYAWQLYAERKNEPVSLQRRSFLNIVLLLGDTSSTMHCGFMRRRTAAPLVANITRIVNDLCTLEKALRQVNSLLYEHGDNLRFNLADETEKVGKWTHNLKEAQQDSDKANALEWVSDIHKYLFGENGLAERWREESLWSIEDLKSFLELEGLYEELIREWSTEIENKAKIKRDNTIIDRWATKEGYRLPEIDVNIPEGTERIMLVAPPIVRQVIWENMKNVVHSPDIFCVAIDEGITDLRIDVIKNNNGLLLDIKMLTKEGARIPEKKTNEEMLSSILGCTVEYEIIHDSGRCVLQTRIPIITVSGLGRVTL